MKRLRTYCNIGALEPDCEALEPNLGTLEPNPGALEAIVTSGRSNLTSERSTLTSGPSNLSGLTPGLSTVPYCTALLPDPAGGTRQLKRSGCCSLPCETRTTLRYSDKQKHVQYCIGKALQKASLGSGIVLSAKALPISALQHVVKDVLLHGKALYCKYIVAQQRMLSRPQSRPTVACPTRWQHSPYYCTVLPVLYCAMQLWYCTVLYCIVLAGTELIAAPCR